jgi:predicted Zn-dependent protease
MLLELSKEYPDENIVQITLARLAVKTGQYEKAINRLLKILEKTPDDANANCLLAEIYSNQGDNDKAMAYQKKCK